MSRFHYRRRQGVRPPALSAGLPRNTVLQGDCITVMASLPKASVDLVLTDPPYLVNYRDRAGPHDRQRPGCRLGKPSVREIAWLMKDKSFCV